MLLTKELIKYVIRHMVAEAVDNKMKEISSKNGNNYSKQQSNQQAAAYPTQPSKTPAPYGWNV